MSWNGEDLFKAVLLGGGSGGSSGGGSSGGGATIFGKKVETGTYISATDARSFNVEHSLNEIPSGVVWWTEADAFADTSRPYGLLGVALIQNVENSYGVRAEIGKESASATSSVSSYGKYKTPSGTTAQTNDVTGSLTAQGNVYNNASKTSVSFASVKGTFPAGVEYKYILF